MKPLYLIFFFLIFSFTILAQSITKRGQASYYADKFEGRSTASGEVYRASEMTAAHRTLPFGTQVKVTNLANRKSVIVRINDRGPHIKKRIIDVSKSAAEALGFIDEGITEVTLEILENEN